jgi:branched chain amino acid efflux pump
VTATVVLVALTLGTYALKATVPLLVGGRELPDALQKIANLLPAALLAALVVVSAVGEEDALVLDERVVGLGAAAVALACRAPFVVVVLVAAAATAAARLL